MISIFKKKVATFSVIAYSGVMHDVTGYLNPVCVISMPFGIVFMASVIDRYKPINPDVLLHLSMEIQCYSYLYLSALGYY